MKKKIILIVVLLIIVAAVYFLLIHKKESIYVGTVEVTKVDITPRLSSVIAKLNVDEGAQVKKDDPLFTLTCEDVKLKKDTLEKDFARGKKLFSSGTITQEAFDHIKAEYDDVSIKLDWCSVKSPLDGTVLDKYREDGELVSPSTKVVTIGDLNTVYAYVYVEHEMMSKLKLNQNVKGLLPEQKMKVVNGVITHINDEAEFTPKNVQTREERTRLVYGIKVTFENKDRVLKPGMPVEVEF